MKIIFEDITLRDLEIKDTEDYVRWNTVDTEWMDWDAPWLKDEPFDADVFRQKRLAYLAKPKDENRIRHSFEIDYEGRHIGWVSSYYIDEKFNFAKDGHLAIGIDICQSGNWGKGIGGKAYAAFTEYLFSHGYDALYTQTWSGNERLMRMAARVGFTLCHRDVGVRQVRGQTYDRITLKLTR